MPCFDDAELRRGKPTVHRRFGEATALLVGDALIVMAFDVMGRAGGREVSILARATGPSRGIIAGQAWEGEPALPLDEYHRAKTAALFEAACQLAALAAGAEPEPWRAFGEVIGRAYQAADDLADAGGDVGVLGKLPGRDAALGRPSIVRRHGVHAARASVQSLIQEARRRLPSCSDPAVVLAWLDGFAERVLAM
jgi:geranylgeranyl diphosphate synthase type II